MSFHFFSKKVYDEDLCFVRDLIVMGDVIASLTSIPVMREVIYEIIKKYGLEAKLQEFIDNGHYIIEDCYPLDRNEKMRRASELLSLSSKIPITAEEQGLIDYRAFECVKKMRFSYDEKVLLIKKIFLDSISESEIYDYLMESYLKSLS